MTTPVRVLIGVFIVLHGLVHPIMALVPQPAEEQSDEKPPVVGGFWTESWLLGDGPSVKVALYVFSSLAALVLFVAGIGFLGPQSWAKTAWLAGAGLSLVVLVVFWDIYFVVGIVIDVLMLIAAYATEGFAS